MSSLTGNSPGMSSVFLKLGFESRYASGAGPSNARAGWLRAAGATLARAGLTRHSRLSRHDSIPWTSKEGSSARSDSLERPTADILQKLSWIPIGVRMRLTSRMAAKSRYSLTRNTFNCSNLYYLVCVWRESVYFLGTREFVRRWTSFAQKRAADSFKLSSVREVVRHLNEFRANGVPNCRNKHKVCEKRRPRK